MNNEIREKDHEWVKMFHSNIDRLLVSIEKLFESRQSGAFNDELLTDKEVAHILKVSRRTLQDYRNNGILSYIQVGGKILYRTSDVQRTIMSGFKEAYRLRDSGQKNNNTLRSLVLRVLVFFVRKFVIKVITSCVCLRNSLLLQLHTMT